METIQQTPIKKKKSPILLITISVILIVAIIISSVLLYLKSSKPYEKPLEDLTEMLNDANYDKMEEAIAPYYIDYLEEGGIEDEESFEEWISFLSLDGSIDLTTEVLSAEKLNREEIEELNELWQDELEMYDIDPNDYDEIEAAYELEVHCYGKVGPAGDKEKFDEEVTLSVVRVDGEWYVDGFGYVLGIFYDIIDERMGF